MAQPHRRAGLAPRCATGGALGTSPNARRTVSADDIAWASVIMVMEEKHKSRLKAEFNRLLTGRVIHVLDIADDYQYMDPELVEQIEQSVASLLDLD